MNNTILNSYSGIKSHQFGLDSISNNIANVNTTGYRENIPEFKSLLSEHIDSINSNTVSSDRNFGTTVSSNAISTKSGNYKPSEGEFDMAYNGKGWFVVGKNEKGSLTIEEDGYEGEQENYFTRDGSFSRDSEGYLVNSSGYYVYGVDLGKIQGNVLTDKSVEEDKKALKANKLTPLKIPQNIIYQPTQTTKVELSLNLNTQKDSTLLENYLFDKNGNFLEQELKNLDVNALFNNEKQPLDARVNNDIRIRINQNDEEKEYIFKYSPKKELGENEFHSIEDLQKLFKEQTGLELDVERNAEGVPAKPLAFELKNTQDDMQLTLGGKFIDRLGLTLSNMPIKNNEAQRSNALYIASYTTNAEIFDDNGDKFYIKTEYYLNETGNNIENVNQKWTTRTQIYDKDYKEFEEKVYETNLEFNSDHQAVKKEPLEIDFKNAKISYSFDGVGEDLSSNLGYQDSALLKTQADGRTEGKLSEIRVDEDGIIKLYFTNGAETPVGRVGIVAFSNDQGLKKAGSNMFEISQAIDNNGDNKILSGAPILGWDDMGEGKLKFGHIMHKYLETSNTDVTSALTNLILMQRGYSMNAKAFNAGDDLMKEAINLKR
ncbi:flagellar hook-basal body complex protein [Helicobacter anatolicus]|uniref:flagellar hook-basal body complex protein n=1 Tax=Helicobacter anatolicus TaxID=2905874 RepID=UPI001E4B05A0|nr:flagellar hook-basal body complex protein [Helicobacter anatolicus]MCE3039102.1 flagellar hook-basal body complex protein [Helicobacter anatolicus]